MITDILEELKTNVLPLYEQRRIMAYLDSVQARLASHKGMISLRELQSATGEELIESTLGRVFDAYG